MSAEFNPTAIKSLDMFRTDPARAAEGDWIDLPLLPGKAVKVTGQNTPQSQALLAKLTSQVPAEDRSDAEKMIRHGDRIKRQVLAACLVDWKGFAADDGTPLPVAVAKDMLTSGEFGHFTSIINSATIAVHERREAAIEDAAKN